MDADLKLHKILQCEGENLFLLRGVH